MGGFGGIIWFLVIGGLFFWMMKKGGCCGGGGKGHVGGQGEKGPSEGHGHAPEGEEGTKKKACH